MRQELTDAWIRALEVRKRTNVYDAHTPGLVLRATPAGVKTFSVFYRSNRRKMTLTLGRWPGLTLRGARDATKAALARVALGSDPAAEKKEARRRADAPSFEDLLSRFIEAREPSLSKGTLGLYRRCARSTGALARREAATCTRGDIRALLERKARESGPTAANRLHQFLRAALRWATAEELIPRNPIDGMKRPRPERHLSAEERTLTDLEVARLWLATEPGPENETAGPFPAPPGACAYARLILLCGTRRLETALARWRDVDLERGTWTIPREHRKGARRGLVVPLPPLAVGLLRDLAGVLPRDPEAALSERLRGHLPPGGAAECSPPEDRRQDPGARVFGSILYHSDETVKRLRRASGVNFVFHDLRASCATGCAEAGAAPHVVALILGHVGVPGVPSVTSLYDRGDRTPEVRSALSAWAARVEALASGKEAPRVLAFRR